MPSGTLPITVHNYLPVQDPDKVILAASAQTGPYVPADTTGNVLTVIVVVEEFTQPLAFVTV